MRRVFIALLQAYRYTLSPAIATLFGPCCRFHPSCSEYGVEALRAHGAWRGLMLTVRRLARCHPWNSGGHDPVPAAHPATVK